MTMATAVLDALRSELADLIRDECDLHMRDEASLPDMNKTFLNGARRLVERVEESEGLSHVRVAAGRHVAQPVVEVVTQTDRPLIAGRLGMMASCRETTVLFDLPPGTKWATVRDETGTFEWTIVTDASAVL